ncbi:Cellobiose dehydrogenase [Paramyrothecium foliicola]|nr:Cellobiose dehydrogenase [Paramyrothecium foliicola]
MAAGTYDVLLRPFREVVKFGQLAQSRAQLDPDPRNNNALQLAARALANEGERALKKISPLLLNSTAEFSEFLLDLALHQGALQPTRCGEVSSRPICAFAATNKLIHPFPDEVTSKFQDIDVLLYDFEDYIDVDSFEKEKFDALQGAIKGLAIVLLDKIRRRAAESSLDEQAPPPIAFVPLPPTALQNDRSATPQTTKRATSRGRLVPMQTPLKPLPEPPRRTSAPDEAQLRMQPPVANTSATRHVSRPGNATSPIKRVPVNDQGWYAIDEAHHVSPPHGQLPRPQNVNAEALRLKMEKLDTGVSASSRHRPLSPESLQSTHPSVTSSTFSPVQYRSSATLSIPENDVPYDDGEWSPMLAQKGYANAKATPVSITGSLGQLAERRHEGHPAHGHYGRPEQTNMHSHVPAPAQHNYDDQFAAGQEPVSPISDSVYTFGNGAISRVSSIRASSSSGSKTDNGRHSSVKSLIRPASGSQGSLGPEASFGIHKGFCRGAQKFLTEGPGVAIKKVGGQGPSPGLGGANGKEYQPEFHSMFSTPIGYTDPVAQCTHCEYKGVYSQLLQDMQQDPLANQQTHGLRYRVRFLFKSHVLTRDLDTAYFACLFCAQAGVTCRDSDATVFQSVSLLFRHLARHPLPLPDVPGISVLYDAIEPSQPGAQDYDLHIPNPSANLEASSAADKIETDAAQAPPLPTVRATKDHIQKRNEKPLARPGPTDAALNSLETLQFLAGARITQVDFPERWEGKWCRGWHDGVYGVFPSRLVELEVPKGFRLSPLPKTGRSAVTRWKWEPKTSSALPWLKLGKGEKVNSITFLQSLTESIMPAMLSRKRRSRGIRTAGFVTIFAALGLPFLAHSQDDDDPTSSVEQESTPFVDQATGLTMERFFGARTSFGFAFAAPNQPAPSSSFIGQLSFPLANGAGWGAFGLKGEMDDNFILAAWADGNGGVMASFRQATDEDNPPEVVGNFKVRPIPNGVFVNATSLTYTFLCENCLDATLGLGPEETVGNAVMGWALSAQAVSNPADPGARLGFHERGMGPFTARWANAKSPQFDQVAALAGPPVGTSNRATPAVGTSGGGGGGGAGNGSDDDDSGDEGEGSGGRGGQAGDDSDDGDDD